MRKTKIICTLGPAVDSEDMLVSLIEAGMDGARFNFSHGSHETHLALLNKLRAARMRTGRPVAAILDTRGPEIRVGTFENSPVTLTAGGSFTLTTRAVTGTAEQVSVTYADLPSQLHPGDRVLIDDGLLELKVSEIRDTDIRCTVVTGGPLGSNKSINLPGISIALPSLTDRDRADLAFAAEQDFDYVAASFVRSADDVRDIRQELDSHGGARIRIIAKVENMQGVDNLDEILQAADGVMVARGDLGVEVPAWDVPSIQKRMIGAANRLGKLVVTATQMLDSMIRNPRPTRAEVSDVANAVFDGSSCVMLSGETASGKYRLEAVRVMVRTVLAAEAAIPYWDLFGSRPFRSDGRVNDAITHTCCLTAKDLDAAAILTPTKTGHTARMVARFRPACPIAALTSDPGVRRQLNLVWGVIPLIKEEMSSTDELFDACVTLALEEQIVQPGDPVVITAGVPIGRVGSTNLIKALAAQPASENK